MRKVQGLFFSLATITLLIIAAYFGYGDTRILTITPEQFVYYQSNDQVQGGGTTTTLAFDEQGQTLECQLTKTENYAWPYCGISIRVYENMSRGIDLSGFHTLWLEMTHSSQLRPNATTRLYLRNYNPAYSNLQDDYTHKYNGIEFVPNDYDGRIQIPLNNLQVMTWWLHDNQIPIEHAGPEISNVNAIEIATGSESPMGEHRMEIKSIAFQGHYIAGETLFLGLLIFWLGFGAIYATAQIHQARKQLQDKEQRELHLQQLNRQLTKQNTEMIELANKDPLTRILNRRGVQDWLVEAQSSSRVLSLMIIDIDRFKQVNDIFGHPIGDDILREFAMVLGLSVDKTDKLVRWGGEEFVVLSLGDSLEELRLKAERIRNAVANHQWVHQQPLTCSIGAAQMDEERFSEVIAAADEGLYQAKQGGRNRVVLRTPVELGNAEQVPA